MLSSRSGFAVRQLNLVNIISLSFKDLLELERSIELGIIRNLTKLANIGKYLY